MRALRIVLPIGLLCGWLACGGDDAPGGAGGSGGSTGGSGGKSVDASIDTSTGGSAGAGTGGAGGASTGGAGGSGGTAGTGTGGVAGKGGNAGTGGNAGAGGGGGIAGTGGVAGTGGTAGGGAGAAGKSGSAGASGTGGAAGSADAGGAGGGSSVSVLQHHNNANRDGVYVDPVLTKTAVATLHVDTTFAGATYAASVYAQPLYLAGSGAVPDLVIVATTQNHVIALNAATGAIVWDQTFGAPVPRSSLCGQAINPSGIIGTPVIDAATRTIYFNAMTLNGTTPADLVYAIDADTGMAKSGWPFDLNARATANARSFVTSVHNQRGALLLAGGRLLVPFGGHGGDCGDYRGWVVSISANDPTQFTTFATRALGGGIWAPSGVASDGTSIYFATGNTMGMINNPSSHPDMYGDGETVFKLPPDLGRVNNTTEYFVPTDWSAMDDRDADIGGTGTLVVDVPGATPSKLLVQLGKDGKAYLINREMMGGQSAPLSAPTVASGPIINAAAWYRTSMGTYVVSRAAGMGCPSGQSGSMIALRITATSPPVASVAWCAGAASNKSPAVSMTDASGANALVWHVGNDNKLRAYDGDTGTVVFNGGGTADTMAASAQFQSPIIASGRVIAASNTRAYAFRP